MKATSPLVSLFFAGLLCFGLQSLTIEQPSTTDSGYSIGQQADDFYLKNYDGKYVSLSDYKDAKGFIVVFTSNHCPYAKAYEDRLIRLHERYAVLGYPVIAINPNAPEASPDDNAHANFLKAKEKNFPFPYLSDSLQQVFPKFGATRTPHVFILDSNRVVRYSGTIDDNAEIPSRVNKDKRYVEAALNRMIQGEDPIITETKAIGCKIRLVPRDSVTGRVRD